jgi:hypothetical protein
LFQHPVFHILHVLLLAVDGMQYPRLSLGLQSTDIRNGAHQEEDGHHPDMAYDRWCIISGMVQSEFSLGLIIMMRDA